MKALFSILLIGFLDAELSLLRWLILNKLASGKDVLETILQIRQTRERIVNVYS